MIVVDGLSGKDAATLEDWMGPIAAAVWAAIPVTDDADAFKAAPGNWGRDHQVCKSHVKRNTEALIESVEAAAASDADGSLAAAGVTAEQSPADLQRLRELIISRRPEDVGTLEAMHRRYLSASAPGAGESYRGLYVAATVLGALDLVAALGLVFA